MITNKIKYRLVILFLIIAGIIGLRALFHQGFYTSHDGWHIVARLYHFDQAVRDGQIMPRWNNALLDGFGYPLFIFSYQLPWIMVEPLLLVGLSIVIAIKFLFLISFIFSGIFMYLYIRDMWGNKSGILAAFIYMYTPYRFANIFVRANMGEAICYIFLPLIFWALYKLSQKKFLSGIIIGSMGISGALLSHIMIIILLIFPLVFIILFYISKSPFKLKFIKSLLIMFFLGLGISMFYILPAVIYRPITIFTNIYHNLYLNHFTPLTKLVYSPWGYGAIGMPGEMSRQVGLVIWVIVLVSTILVLLNIIKGKKLNSQYTFIIGLIICFLLSIFLMLKSSIFFWKIIEPLTLIDFPWRLLSVTTFIGAILSGFCVILLPSDKMKIAFIIIFIVFAIYSNRNHIRVNQYTDIPLSLYIASERTTNTDDEYLPKWVNRDQIKQKLPILENKDIIIINQKQSTNKTEIIYSSNVPTQTNVAQMYFPGVKVTVDNLRVDFEKSSYGGINVKLPKGKHILDIVYEKTIYIQIGEIITILSLIILFTLIINIKYKLFKL